MKNLFNYLLAFFLLIGIFGCSRIEKTEQSETSQGINTQTSSAKQEIQNPPRTKLKTDVDVIQFANKSASVFDGEFGTPVKITPIKDNPRLMPGEFREYAIAGHPKNLSVRFYKDKAKRFNLLLGSPEKSSKNALKDIFKIDVSGMKKAKSDSLSETWTGKVDRINFETAYAKRSRSGGDFVMLHAEVE